jgi:hypothetical protein
MHHKSLILGETFRTLSLTFLPLLMLLDGFSKL